MTISKVADSILVFFEKILGHKCRILSIVPKEDGWEASCEIDIDPNYTTRRGISDVVEVYDVQLNGGLEVVGFSLRQTKRKASLDKE